MNQKGTTAFWLEFRYHLRLIALFSAALLVMFPREAMAQDPETNELHQSIQRLKQVPLEDLLNIEIISVSRQSERLSQAASAVQVITSEDIRRSGASSLPEALRLAPNLHVAQVDSRQWAISSRGFNETVAANKLLVLIDGRTVYTPLFSGVFWDVQHVMLEDVERVEVISGPGATLWGANAVNGVINVITKSADRTQGGLVTAGGGTFLEEFASVRYGDKIGKDIYFRVYGMGFGRDSALLASGREGTNDWRLGQGGFRADWLPEHGEKITVQGDFYGGKMEQAAPGDTTVNGQNLVARWTHRISDESDTVLQAYWDRTWRRIPDTFREALNTYDIDFQHRITVGERNRVVWGLAYRLMDDEVINGPGIAFLPGDKTLNRYSAFLQDEITLVEDKLLLTLGSKFEHNTYSGFELQPSGRIAWMVTSNHTIWSAISRAVRTPSRIDTDLAVPRDRPRVLLGLDDFESEELVAYELGHRAELSRRVTVSTTVFFHDYDDLRSVEPVPGRPGVNLIRNELSAETYGAELAATWQVMDPWRLRGGYTYFEKHVIFGDSQDINRGTGEGNDPHHQFLVQSMLNLPANFEFDAVFRYVDNLNQRGPTVPGYASLDLRLAWHPRKNWEIAVVGQNLLDHRHPEFGRPEVRQEIPRAVYGKVTWRF